MKRQVTVIVDANGRVVGTHIALEHAPVPGSAHARLVAGPDQEQHTIKIALPSRPPATPDEVAEYHSKIEKELKKQSK